MKRTTPLRRSSPLPRGETPIKKRNAKRGGSRFPKRRDPAYCAWIRTLPCLLREVLTADWRPACAGRVECAHVQSRGAGGDDVANTVPLCTHHHRRQHCLGIRGFQGLYGLRLAAIATRLANSYPGGAA
jgi:hypothetical protein